MDWDFPGGLVAIILNSQCSGPGSIPGQGTGFLHATPKKERKKRENVSGVQPLRSGKALHGRKHLVYLLLIFK